MYACAWQSSHMLHESAIHQHVCGGFSGTHLHPFATLENTGSEKTWRLREEFIAK